MYWDPDKNLLRVSNTVCFSNFSKFFNILILKIKSSVVSLILQEQRQEKTEGPIFISLQRQNLRRPKTWSLERPLCLQHSSKLNFCVLSAFTRPTFLDINHKCS